MSTKSLIDSVVTEGVTFNNVRAALAYMYFGHVDMSIEEWEKAKAHVVPLQHNIENPIVTMREDGDIAKDTFIEYWIDEDDRLTQDTLVQRNAADNDEDGTELTPFQSSECEKTARITVRFIGADGEAWAKIFHHITKRTDVGNIFADYCNAKMLEYLGPIRPINVDYFGVQNTAVAYDVVIVLQYTEVIRLPSELLGLISIAAGAMRLN